jgi:hypothetical protein
LIVHVRDSSTLKNLQQLRGYILKHPEENKIALLIDPRTGEMQVPQPIQDLDLQIPLKGKEHPESVKLLIHPGKQGIQFDLLDAADRKANTKKFHTHALIVLNETLNILNLILGPLYRSAQELFQHLDSVKMELPNEIQVRREWHAELSRKEAEHLLKRRPVGTYLLREGDPETREIEGHLPTQLPFRFFVVTFVEDLHKISDRLFIQHREGWAIYDDNPDLGSYRYQKDLTQLLRSIGARWPYTRST